MVAMSDVDEETEFHLYSLIHHQSFIETASQNDFISTLSDTKHASLNERPRQKNVLHDANPFKRSFEQVIHRPRKLPLIVAQQKSIGRRNCVKDIQPLLNNMPDHHWGISHDLRLKTFNHQFKCISCNKNGHKHFECPYQLNTCYLCGEKDHKMTQHKFCSVCLDDDHHTNKCFYKKRAQKPCHICKSKGHWKEICLSKWRQYYMTTQSIYYNNTKYKPSAELQSYPSFCYNCGNKGHNGKTCSAARMSRFVPHDPANIMFNKCPPPKQIKDSHEPNLVFIEDKSGTITNTTFNHSLNNASHIEKATTFALYPRHEKTLFSLSLFPSNSLPCSLLYKGNPIVDAPNTNIGFDVTTKPKSVNRLSPAQTSPKVLKTYGTAPKTSSLVSDKAMTTKKANIKIMPPKNSTPAQNKNKDITKAKPKASTFERFLDLYQRNSRKTLYGCPTSNRDFHNDSGLGQELKQRPKHEAEFCKVTPHKFVPKRIGVVNRKQDRDNNLKAWRIGLEQKMLLNWE